MSKLTQKSLILGYYKQHPNRNIPHAEVVDWAVAEWKARTNSVFRDPDRAIRSLHQEGLLLKIGTGVYRFDPDGTHKPQLHFSVVQREKVLKRDHYKCVICGQGREHGMELHVDHIKPQKFGGMATIENAQTLCSYHNMQKGTLNQTETGKRMFIRFYELAVKDNDQRLCDFIKDVLEVYEKHGINSHIDWEE